MSSKSDRHNHWPQLRGYYSQLFNLPITDFHDSQCREMAIGGYKPLKPMVKTMANNGISNFHIHIYICIISIYIPMQQISCILGVSCPRCRMHRVKPGWQQQIQIPKKKQFPPIVSYPPKSEKISSIYSLYCIICLLMIPSILKM